MSSKSESDNEVMLAVACYELAKREPRFWVHDINLKREECGEFSNLFPDLLQDEDKFFKYFKMSSKTFFDLVAMLPFAKNDTTFRKCISLEERLAVTLKFLGHGDTFATLSFSYRLGETTVREIVYETCELIWRTLQPLVMPTPTEEQWKRISEDCLSKWNFQNCLGALDGKHVVFEKPPCTGSTYYNYKHQFSIVLLALVDADYRFITVDVGAAGRNSDGGVFSSSSLGRSLKNKSLNVPKDIELPGTKNVLPYVIVADEAFPLTTYLMRPYPGQQATNDEAKRIYNYRHYRMRRVVENAFGIMAKKFRIFNNKFNISPEHLETIVMATTVLHNFLRNDSCSWQPGELEQEEPLEGLANLQHSGMFYSDEAFLVRDTLKNYFVSSAGRVPWQRESILRGRIHQV